MKLSFISSRRRQGQEDREETMPGTVQISVPSELVMSILTRGAILQVQIGPVPIRPVLRPASSPERPEPAPLRPNPSGGSDADPPRPERPPSRHPAARNARTVRPMRAVSPFTDWSSLPENNDVISISSSDEEDNYVPRSPEYIPNSPEPETETEDQNPRQNVVNLVPQGELVKSITMTMRIDPDLLWVEVTSYKLSLPISERTGSSQKRPQLGRIRPM